MKRQNINQINDFKNQRYLMLCKIGFCCQGDDRYTVTTYKTWFHEYSTSINCEQAIFGVFMMLCCYYKCGPKHFCYEWEMQVCNKHIKTLLLMTHINTLTWVNSKERNNTVSLFCVTFELFQHWLYICC